jgi:hypothetical protein
VYWSTFLSPARQLAQVPNQVMIWLAPHWSERQTVFCLWALVYGSHAVHLDLSELKISVSTTGGDTSVILDTSSSAVVWNVTVAASEAATIFLDDIEWVSA